jgi:uncharacterized protein with von Willebrand factor type A (vWA) domain
VPIRAHHKEYPSLSGISRYSSWDGQEEAAPLDADMLMDALSDDLIADGDITNALQRMIRWGLQGKKSAGSDHEEVSNIPGLQHLLQRLREQRQQELNRYNLGSVLEDIRAHLQEIVQREQLYIQQRLAEAHHAQVPEGNAELLNKIARKKLRSLDHLPPEPAEQLAALQDYEFMDPGAREQFSELLQTLQKHVLAQYFQSIQQALQALTPNDLAGLRETVHDLNETLRQQLRGESPDFDEFMRKHGQYFPQARSLDDIIDYMLRQMGLMQSLLDSMPVEMRHQLEDTLATVLRDEQLVLELGRLAAVLQYLAPSRRNSAESDAEIGLHRSYAFGGEESLDLAQALRLMERLRMMNELERELKRAQETGNLTEIDILEVSEVLGPEAQQAVEQLQQLTKTLEEAGYIEVHGSRCELTPRGIRKIGQWALQDIFSHLKRDTFGVHTARLRSSSTSVVWGSIEESKPYEFGDAFLLDLEETLMNAIKREGAGSPLHLTAQDFSVYRPEHTTQASTVLMLDMSRSMPLRGCFIAAKKVAIALNSLIRTQFPRDNLYIIGFSDYARELKPETLHQISWGDYVYGTNMQHGFMLARKLLARHKGNKQIILITDGEPTAHFEGNHVHFSYPPTFRTFQETLREVKRCTSERIIINTFMLDRSHYLTDFVNQMARINRGRVFFATPERLGEYILVDYVASKRKVVGR